MLLDFIHAPTTHVYFVEDDSILHYEKLNTWYNIHGKFTAIFVGIEDYRRMSLYRIYRIEVPQIKSLSR